VLIDGAHALGQLPVNLAALAPDYFVSNCHKWLGGARGSALLWVRRGLQAGVRPLVVSHGSGCGFLSDFIWDGGWHGVCLIKGWRMRWSDRSILPSNVHTPLLIRVLKSRPPSRPPGCRDYAPLLSLSTALAWWRAVGPARARGYMHTLLLQAVELLEARWGTQTIAPQRMLAAMACVELPASTVAAAQRQRLRLQGAAAAVGSTGRGSSGSEVQSEDKPLGPPTSEDASWIQVNTGCVLMVGFKLAGKRLPEPPALYTRQPPAPPTTPPGPPAPLPLDRGARQVPGGAALGARLGARLQRAGGLREARGRGAGDRTGGVSAEGVGRTCLGRTLLLLAVLGTEVKPGCVGAFRTLLLVAVVHGYCSKDPSPARRLSERSVRCGQNRQRECGSGMQ
jgi:hypothetical protein